MTGTIIYYEYASGQYSFDLDTIISTYPNCQYDWYNYDLKILSQVDGDLTYFGISVDNSVQPARVTIF